MCTVSWLNESSGYRLFASRDEKKSRAGACPPRAFAMRGVRCAAPIDPDGGGTWVSVNEFGVALCLLNGAPGNGLVSRGRLVLELTVSKDQDEAVLGLQRMPLDSYPAFTLAVLEPGRPVLVAGWDGRELAILPNGSPLIPLSSSSSDAVGAERARTRLYRAMRPRSAEASIAFHASHWPEPGPLSPCMHREDAATVSFTVVHVTPESVRMTYHDGPLCSPSRPHSVYLDASCLTDSFVHSGE